jgi:hypothetical protein
VAGCVDRCECGVNDFLSVGCVPIVGAGDDEEVPRGAVGQDMVHVESGREPRNHLGYLDARTVVYLRRYDASAPLAQPVRIRSSTAVRNRVVFPP